MLRLAAGDGNAIFGLLGLTFGIWIGTLFFKGGYNLGRTQTTHTSVGWVLPLTMLGFFILMLVFPQIEGQTKSNILFYSIKGPGARHAQLFLSLVVGLAIGFVAQRSRFCTMGALRDLILFRQVHLLTGVIALVVTAFIVNLIVGQFHPGLAGQPVAHTMQIWNFGGGQNLLMIFEESVSFFYEKCGLKLSGLTYNFPNTQIKKVGLICGLYNQRCISASGCPAY